jgi:hypothetical protein
MVPDEDSAEAAEDPKSSQNERRRASLKLVK